MRVDDSNFLKEKLRLFESSQTHAWIKWTKGKTIEILSASSSLSALLPGSSYLLSDLIHKNDLNAVRNHYANVNEDSWNIQFRIKGNSNVYCSSQQMDGKVISVWVISEQNDSSATILQMAAHDIRSPINSIMGLATLALQMIRDGEMTDMELDKILEMIKSSCYQATDLTSDILELAKIESEEYSLQTGPVVMKDFLTQYFNTHRLLTLKKKISVKFDSSVEVQVKINRPKVTRALDNLMTNAVKFSHVGSVIKVSLEEKDKFILVKIKDEGVGMSEKALENIFVKFGKSQRTGLDGEISHGLGMSIVKQIMDLHQGEVTVESKVGKGTTVSLIFNK